MSAPAPISRRHALAAVLGALLLAAAAIAWTSCSLVNQELPNQPPVVQVREADTTVVARGGRVELTVTASDEDDDPLRYLWTAGGAGSFTDSTSSTTFWIAPSQIEGNSEYFLLSVTVVDSQPETDDPVETFLIQVVQRAPVLTAPGDTTVSFRDPVVVLQASATDEDHDALTFAWRILDDGLPADRVRLQAQTRDGVSTARLLTLEPGQVHLEVATTDGSDTLRNQFRVTVVAPELPAGGTATLELPLSGGATRSYEMDVYEYPNQRGVAPLLVDSWFDAEAACRDRGMRLCSRDEWVNACRGADGFTFSSVDDHDALPSSFGRRFCNEQGSDLWGGDAQDLEAVAPSGSFPNCTSGTGVFDLTGNAFEWVQEWVPPAANATTTVGVGRSANFSLSNTTFAGTPCAQFSSRLEVIQLQGELPRPVPQAFIDSVLSAPIAPAFVDSAAASPSFQNYFTPPGSRRGFRCCR